MDFKLIGVDTNPFHHLHQILDSPQPSDDSSFKSNIRDAKAIAATPADVKEYADAYYFIVDMPGLKSEDIKVQVEDDNVLVISGERKREEEEGAKYIRMESRVGKFMRKFAMPKNADVNGVSAVCQDGVLTRVQKKLPPQPKTIQVTIA